MKNEAIEPEIYSQNVTVYPLLFQLNANGEAERVRRSSDNVSLIVARTPIRSLPGGSRHR
jgi:hypothetical protein